MISLSLSIQKIVNVYKTIHHKKPFGLGDYLRGCLFLSQISHLHKISFCMNYSEHPISSFLINEEIEPISDDKIIIMESNFQKNNIYSYNQSISLFNSFQKKTIYVLNHSFPFLPIQHSHVFSILKQIKPNDILQKSILQYLQTLQLKSFHIIHIRLGDELLVHKNKFYRKTIYKLFIYLKRILDPRGSYLLLSDNNEIKFLIYKYFPFVSFKKTKITHLGLQDSSSEEVLDTLTDFFLMKYSSSITSFSIYTHKTSFSEVASILFSKPFYFYSLL